MKRISTISDEINRLHQAELDKTNKEKPKHTGASIEPVYSRPDNDLDVLARLMTGSRDVCTAVCLDGNNLLVSNNSGDSISFGKCVDLLRTFISSPFKDNYDPLEQEAWRKAGIINNQPKINKKVSNLSSIEEQTKFASKAGIIDILNDQNASPQAKNIAAEILQPVIDTRRITAAIAEGRLDPKISNTLMNPDENMRFIRGNEGVHAEMKIIDALGQSEKLGKGTNYDIGLSKLCCCACAITIKGVEKDYGATFDTPGTHGGTYERWVAPQGLEQIALRELSVLEGGGHKKLPETTINPDLLPPPRPILSEFANEEHLEAAREKAHKVETQAIQDLGEMHKEHAMFKVLQAEYEVLSIEADKTLIKAKSIEEDKRNIKSRLDQLEKKMSEINSSIHLINVKNEGARGTDYREELEKILQGRKPEELIYGAAVRYKKLQGEYSDIVESDDTVRKLTAQRKGLQEEHDNINGQYTQLEREGKKTIKKADKVVQAKEEVEVILRETERLTRENLQSAKRSVDDIKGVSDTMDQARAIGEHLQEAMSKKGKASASESSINKAIKKQERSFTDI